MTNGVPEIGDRLTWVPAAFVYFEKDHAERIGALAKVSGEVVYVHRDHGFYRVRAPLPGGGSLHECFKF